MLRVHLTSTTSTNDAAQRWAARHPGHAVLVSARTQTAGRGRGGRPWRSPAGGAWFSVAWPVTAPLQRYAAAPLVVGLAVARTLDTLLTRGTRVQIKWPNDLLLDDAKLAGILCETAITGDRPATLIAGVGINVNLDAADLGDDMALPATSMRAAVGRSLPLGPLIDAMGHAVAAALGRLDAHGLTGSDRDAIEDRLAWRGETVSLRCGGEVVRGEVRGLAGDGQLVLQTAEGLRTVRSGEVSRLRLADVTIRSPLALQESVI